MTVVETSADLQNFPKDPEKIEPEIKAYKRRWVIVCIFISYAAISAFQWIEYSVINNIVMKYYKVSAVAVDWTSIIYLVPYAPLIIPSSYIVDKKGLRTSALFGAAGTALGTAIKVLSIGRDSYYIVIIGQTLLAFSNLLILSLPPKIAAVWFKGNEVSTACSLGVFGTQLGCALGFLIPSTIVRNHENPDDIGSDLRVLCWGLTAFAVPSVLAVIFFFPNQPAKPPSHTQIDERNNTNKFKLATFLGFLKQLFLNVPYVVHCAGFAINLSLASAGTTLLNQFVLQYFPGCEQDVGYMGLGMFSSVFMGIFLDKTHRYKEMTVASFALYAVAVVGQMYAMEFHSKVLTYMAVGFTGLFASSYNLAAFEFSIELTYPSPESTTTGILVASCQLLGVPVILLLGRLNQSMGTFWTLAIQAAVLALGTLLSCFIPSKLQRQDAFRESRNKVMELQPSQIINE